ncbi:uncharacterized protein LOC114950042 [Acropora millepora]|uniref:uncharacterized protein LOC114950042 n=1 Tax=Acropora millepora TaxID=45264 RepID=UPI001CF509C0|nr:uncharacterized protein LOC114950042 [Acropora millepora]
MRSPFVVASVFSLLLLARLLFTVLFIVPAFVCLTHDTTTETCGNAVFKQGTKNTVNMVGTLVEAGNSFLLVILIFRWEKFKVTNFLRAAPRLAVFWFWISLFVVQAITVFNMDILSGHYEWLVLGCSLLLEFATLVILSLALKFIEKGTVKAWIRRNVYGSHSANYLYYSYMLTLWVYLLRNLALVSYDMALLTKKIDLHAYYKPTERLLKLGAIAFRTSFVQFFYAAIFKNNKMPQATKDPPCSRNNHCPNESNAHGEVTQAHLSWKPFIT